MVCDLIGSKSCVECTVAEPGACGGETPICGGDNACRGCVAHAECDSKACLADGSCAPPDQVAYVAPSSGGTDSGNCTFAIPCITLTKALTTGRPSVKLEGTVNDQVTLTNRSVTLLGEPGARLASTNPGTLLLVGGPSQVAIYDLEISGANGFGIATLPGSTPTISLVRVKLSGNEAGGLAVTGSASTILQSTISGNVGAGIVANGGVLTVSQSTISGNAGGGISLVNGAFVIVGNVFFNNGSDMGPVGGVALGATPSGANRLEFNSFNSNKAQAGVGAGVACAAGTFTARNNIISENGTSNMVQVSGACMHAYSIVRPGPVPPGPGNSSMDPLFQNPATGDLHLRPGSPAIDAADPSSVLAGVAARDIDGDVRSAPASIGADELP